MPLRKDLLLYLSLSVSNSPFSDTFYICSSLLNCLSMCLTVSVWFSFCFILFQNIEDHVAFVITVPTALAIFLAVFVLVCIESIFKKLLRVFSLVIWACLVAMGYLFMFSGGIICPWDQVSHRCILSWIYLYQRNMWFVCVSPVLLGNFRKNLVA